MQWCYSVLLQGQQEVWQPAVIRQHRSVLVRTPRSWDGLMSLEATLTVTDLMGVLPLQGQARCHLLVPQAPAVLGSQM